MTTLEPSGSSVESQGRRRSRQSIGGDSFKPRIENNILFSPYPPVEIPVCSIYTAVKRFLNQPGSKIAVVDCTQSLTRQALLRMIECHAGGFQELGIRPGDHVCVHLRNNVENFVIVFGMIFAGATVILSNTTHKHHELLYRMDDGDATHIVTDSGCVRKVRDVCDVLKIPEKNRFVLGEASGFTSVAGFELLSRDAFVEVPVPDPRNTIAAIAYTAGTTGSSRGVEITHYSFVANLMQNQAVTASDDTDVFLAWNPITNMIGFLFTMLAACVGSTCVITSPTLSFHEFRKVCSKYEVSSLFSFPMRLHYLVREMKLANIRLPHVRKVCVGGGRVTEELANDARIAFPNLRSFRSMYSLSECCGLLAAPPQSELNHTDLGFPTPNVELKFLNVKSGKAVGPMEQGEIAFRTPSTMRGYYKRPLDTAETLDSEGWCRTGDVAYFDESGRVHFVEQLRELIHCMGRQVEPEELEQTVLHKCPKVCEVAVVGLPHPEHGEVPTAFVVVSDEYKGTVTEDDIKNAVTGVLPVHKQLGAVYFPEYLPHTETGNVRRAALRQDPVYRQPGRYCASILDSQSTSRTQSPFDGSASGLAPVRTASAQEVS